ncbi:MAG: RNA methyltransferase [Eudoraea sp.]|nr:RNA methyltransferase [Eudoraea sp.]
MVVKSQLKYIKSLQQKKFRNTHNRFVAEGLKTVSELLGSGCKVKTLMTTEVDLSEISGQATQLISTKQMAQISSLKNPSGVLGVFEIPKPVEVEFSDWVLALDSIRDPGNLGTIIRLCDWFGIAHLLCSPDTVDAYNPKVLQATMGSIARVNLVYTDLSVILKSAPVPVYGAFMDGDSVYETKLPKNGILVLGNEARGISKDLSAVIGQKLGIPQYGQPTAESLNVATATGILLNEIRRA